MNRSGILKEADKYFSSQGSISAAVKSKYATAGSTQIPPLSSLTKVMTDAYTCLVSPPRVTRRNSLTAADNQKPIKANSINKNSKNLRKGSTSTKTSTASSTSQPKSSTNSKTSSTKTDKSRSLVFSSLLSGSSFSPYPYTSKTHLTTSIEFSFVNEVGTGTGPTLEFYDLLAQKMLEKNQLFTIDEETQLVSFTVPPKFYSKSLCVEIEKYCLCIVWKMCEIIYCNKNCIVLILS